VKTVVLVVYDEVNPPVRVTVKGDVDDIVQVGVLPVEIVHVEMVVPVTSVGKMILTLPPAGTFYTVSIANT